MFIEVLENKLEELKTKQKEMAKEVYELRYFDGYHGRYLQWNGINHSIMILSELIREIKEDEHLFY